METRTSSLLFIILFGVICISLVACVTGPSATASSTRTMTQMLQEAGFKAYPAGTSQEMAHIQACPKDTLMIHERPGQMCYAFPDPATKSMYMGDEAAYQRLKAIMQQQQQPIREQRYQEDPEFWRMWGSRWGLG